MVCALSTAMSYRSSTSKLLNFFNGLIGLKGYWPKSILYFATFFLDKEKKYTGQSHVDIQFYQAEYEPEHCRQISAGLIKTARLG